MKPRSTQIQRVTLNLRQTVLIFCMGCVFTLQSQNTLDNVGLTSATPASGAFSLRKLSSSYAGSAILVRRSSDNTTQAIGFLASGYLDTTSLKSFVGVGNSGFVNTWYDQSGNSNHAVQATFASQPRIVNAGVVDRVNGLPAIFTDGVDDQLVAPNSPTNNFSIFILERTSVGHQIDAESNSSTSGTSGQNYILGAIQSGTDGGQGLSVGTNGISNYEHGNSYMPPTAVYSGAVNGLNVIDVIYASKTPSVYLNSALVRAGVTSPKTIVYASRQIGSGSYGAFNGYIPEFIVFPSAFSSANRQILDCNQGSYYNVNYGNTLAFHIQGNAANFGCNIVDEQVVWKNSDLVNTQATSNNLVKVQSNNVWDGGAASTNTVSNNGSLKFLVTETNTTRMVGLSSTNANANFSSIQYAVYLRGDGQWEIYESGSPIGNFGSYATNDIFKVSVENNFIKYYHNNVVRYISVTAPTLPLLVDVSIYSQGGTVTNAAVSNYNTGTFTATAVNAPSTPSYQWKLNGSNVGSNSASYSNTSLGNNDVVSCVLTFSNVCGTVSVTSNTLTNIAVSASNDLDFYITGTPATVACKQYLEDVKWVTALTSVKNNIITNSLSKTHSDNSWDGNGFSTQAVLNNGYMQTTVVETNEARMVGLSSTDANASFSSIQYAFFMTETGTLLIYESGSNRGSFGSYATNDVLKIAVESNFVKYYKNGVPIYISTIAPSLPLYVDVSTYHIGATANNVKISNGHTGAFAAVSNNLGVAPTYQWKLNGSNVGSNSLTYTNTALTNLDVVNCLVVPDLGGCSTTSYTSPSISIQTVNPTTPNEFYVSAATSLSACKEAKTDVVWVIASSALRNTINTNSLTKLTSDGNWDGNGFSFQSIDNNGYIEMTAVETTTERMVGLSSTDANSSYTSIQFAFFLAPGGVLYIFESGNNRGIFGSYTGGDVFKIAVESNVVKYYKNGVQIYISAVTPSLPLFVDASTKNVGATISNVKISNGSLNTFTAITTNLGPSPSYQWKLNGLNVGSNSASYVNANLANADIVSCFVTPNLNACSTSSYSSNNITIGNVNPTIQNEFYISGAASQSACKEALSNVVWVIASSSLKNAIATNTLTKITSDGNWDGNGFSFQSVENNGYMQMTASETTTERMVGLSASDANSSYTSIQFAFFLAPGGVLYIFESGNNRGTFGSYNSGDVFKIAIESNVVKYYKNGVPIYISAVTPLPPLFVDVSIKNTGGTVSDVKISNGSISTFTAIGTNLGTSPTYQWKLNGLNVGSNSPTYINTNLANADVVSCLVTPSLSGCSTSSYSSNNITIGNINPTIQNEFYISGAASQSACKEALSDVVWVIASSSLKNTISTNTLTKLTSDGNWDGNGFSFQSVENNGYMQMTALETTTERMVGLSATDGNANYTSIQFAFYLAPGGNLYVFESGNNRGAFGTYVNGDVFKIAIESNVVKYYKNGVPIYISAVTPSPPLFVDASTKNVGATVANVKISNGSISSFTAIGTNLGASPAYQWKLNGSNVGSNSSTYINTNLANADIVSCLVTPSLSGCSTSSYSSNNITIGNINPTIQNEFYISGAAAASACKEAISDVVWVIASSSLKNTISTNSLTKLTSDGNWDGNGFSFQSVGNNGYMQMTAAETTTERMIGLSASDGNANYTSIQFAFYLAPGGSLNIYESGNNRGNFGSYTGGDVLKIAVESNIVKYYKNGSIVYISTISPSLPLYVDVSTKNVGATASNVKISNGNISTFSAIGTNLGTSPTYQWKLNGSNVGSNSATYVNTSLSNADMINCLVTPSITGCSTSSFSSNNITIGNINQTLQNEFYLTGAIVPAACKEALADVVWVIASSTQKNAINGNTLTKLTSDGNWDGNGFSFQAVGNNGYMQTTIAEINKERMVGLSSSDGNANYTSIQYAFYLQNGGNLYIFQSGNNMGSFGSYSISDVLKISVESNVVKYYKNGTLLYISGVSPTLPLYVDVSLNNVGATANDVKISNGNISTFNAVGTNLGTAPIYQWKLNGSNVGVNSPTYSNTGLVNNDVVTCLVTPDLGGCSTNTFAANNVRIAEPTTGTTTWLGSTTAWNTSANWSNGVPTKYTSAIITSGSSNPVISSNAIVNNITIGSGRSLTINNSSYNLEVFGNFTNQGSFTPNNSTIYMYGCSSTNTLSSTTGISFNNLVIDNTNGLVIGGPSNVTVNNALTLTNGAVTTGTNILILANTNAANLAYTNGFINGNFRRNIASNASTYFFAVGSGTNSADRHLSAFVNNFLTGVSFINASVREFTQLTPNNDANLTAIQNTLALVSSLGKTTGQTTIWDFTPNSAPSGGSYGVNLYTENTNLSGSDDNTFCPLKRSISASYANFSSFEGTTTIPAIGSPGRIYNSGAGYAERLGYTSFSEYIIAKTSGGILPVKLISFDANPVGDDVALNWLTASEKNSAYFTVEKGKDALNFEVVGTVRGAGNSNSTRAYSLVDIHPFSGLSYYRLKQTDFDGKFTHSKIVAVNFNNKNNLDLLVYPNPNKSGDDVSISILGSLNSTVYLDIYDGMGKKQYSRTLKTNSENDNLTITVPSQLFSPGIYIITATSGETVLNRKLIFR
jgi:hypothetical protein